MRLKWHSAAALAVLITLGVGSPCSDAAALSLDEAVEMALSRNYDIKISQKEREAAEQSLRSAKGANGLSLNATGSLNYSDINRSGDSKGSSSRLAVSLPLYTGNKNELSIAKAKEEITVADLNHLRTLEDTELKTVEAYYEILEAQKVMQVDEETVNNYREHLQDVQNLYHAGITPKVDVLRSQVELSDAEQNLISSKNAYEVALTSLRNIIRYDETDMLTVVDEADYRETAYTLADCLAYARDHRSDLAAYQVKIRQAQKDVGIAKSGHLPSVSLSVSNGWSDQILFSGDNHDLTAGITANWNLFDSNVTDAAVKKAEIALEQAEYEFAKQSDAVDLAVRENYLNMREAEKRFATTRLAVGQAEEDYFIAREKYKVGQGVMLDIIDAQLALSTAKKNEIQARYDYVTNKARLENAMGVKRGVENE